MTLFVDGLWIHGGQPSALLGDPQGVSNLSAPPKITLYEAWIQYNVDGNKFSALIGRYDLNTEFYRLLSAGLFLNSSFGIGSEFSGSGAGGPSIFPNTSLGLRLAFKPTTNVVVRGTILDGAPVDRADGAVGAFRGSDGLLLVSEVAVLNRKATSDRMETLRFRIGRASGLPPYDDKVAAGAWYYTATFDGFEPCRCEWHTTTGSWQRRPMSSATPHCCDRKRIGGGASPASPKLDWPTRG